MFGLAAAAAVASCETPRTPFQMMMVRDRISAMQHTQLHGNGIVGNQHAQQQQNAGGGPMTSMTTTKSEMSSPPGDSGGGGLGATLPGIVPLPAGTVRNWCMQPSIVEQNR